MKKYKYEPTVKELDAILKKLNRMVKTKDIADDTVQMNAIAKAMQTFEKEKKLAKSIEDGREQLDLLHGTMLYDLKQAGVKI